MGFTRIQVAIAASTAALLVFGFLGYIQWLSNQGPVLARSEERDTLSGLPVSIRMNPLRDRTIEHSANIFLRQLRDGQCDQLLSHGSTTTAKNTLTSSAIRKRSIHYFPGNWRIGRAGRPSPFFITGAND